MNRQKTETVIAKVIESISSCKYVYEIEGPIAYALTKTGLTLSGEEKKVVEERVTSLLKKLGY